MGDEGVEGTPPTLVMWDDGHRAMWVLPVDRKGPVEYVVAWIIRKLDEAGYSGVPLTLKSDQEPAIMDLKKSVALRRQAATAPIESPVRESQSNGTIERAIRSWQGQFRTLRHQLEANIGAKVSMESPIVEWMAIWAAELITRFVLRESGRTAYESITGHRCKQPTFMFGETIMFRCAPDKTGRHKSESEWSIGVFVGVESRSSEYLIVNKHGLYKCRTMRRLPRDKAFIEQSIDDVKHGLETYIKKGAQTTLAVRQGELAAPGNDAGRVLAPRRMRLNPDDFTAHGFTDGCRGCIWLQDQVGIRPGHSEACRKNMEEVIKEAAGGQERIDRAQG